mmetsp:Transcript_28539/g.43122  ORF Transcript_28539/g.43122 Transcript_28539/m.43122 type:complete len:141 (+) Transcript_28539:2627-3049(+)
MEDDPSSILSSLDLLDTIVHGKADILDFSILNSLLLEFFKFLALAFLLFGFQLLFLLGFLSLFLLALLLYSLFFFKVGASQEGFGELRVGFEDGHVEPELDELLGSRILRFLLIVYRFLFNFFNELFIVFLLLSINVSLD